MLTAAYAGAWSLRLTRDEATRAFMERWPTDLPRMQPSDLHCEDGSGRHLPTPALGRPVLGALHRSGLAAATPPVLVLDSLRSIGDTAREIVTNLAELQRAFRRIVVVEVGDHDEPVELEAAARSLLEECLRIDRTQRRERVRRGHDAARRAGRAVGRPFRLDPALWSTVLRDLDGGQSIRSIARRLGVAEGTIRGIRDRHRGRSEGTRATETTGDAAHERRVRSRVPAAPLSLRRGSPAAGDGL